MRIGRQNIHMKEEGSVEQGDDQSKQNPDHNSSDLMIRLD